MSVESEVRGKSIEALGIETNYHDVGEGAPLILVHGSGPGVSAYANWGRTIPVLSQNFRVVAPDVAGFGFTLPPDDTTYSMDFWVDHLVAFMDEMKIERAHFLGNSFGGGLVLALAVRHPERIDRMMLMGSAGLDYTPPSYDHIDLSEGLTAKVMKQVATMFTYYPETITDEMVDMRQELMKLTGGMKREAQMFPGNPKLSRVATMMTPVQLIAKIDRPTLLVHGRDDQIMPPAISQRLHDLIAGSDLHIFARCGHWSQLDRFDEFNALATAFFSASEG